jgi:mannitol-1-phosphate 5-dehydrogenase
MLVQFGAGNIGRGFIAPTFTQAGWSVLFVDIDARRLAALQRRGGYEVIEVDGSSEHRVQVSGVSGIDARDHERVSAALAACELCATAVGVAALPEVARALALGLRSRHARGRGPLDILVCENGATVHTVLSNAILSALPDEERAELSAGIGVVRTSIGRMIPAATGQDELDLRVEPYASLPVDRAGFRGIPPLVDHLDLRSDFDLVVHQKLYLHNLTHACLAYAGHLGGHLTIPDCMADAEIVAGVERAGAEACLALARTHATDPAGRTRIQEECASLVGGLMQRYRNRALNDPVARVGRDPWRKLAGDDRLVGAARLCEQTGVTRTAILWHLLAACRYTPAADEPRAAAWHALQCQGSGPLLQAVSGLRPGDPLLVEALALEQVSAFLPMRTP